MEIFFNQLGMELTKLGGSDDPMEGTNVTLLCSQLGSESPLKWSITQGNSQETITLNETDLPKGSKEVSYTAVKNCVFELISPYNLGMNITNKMDVPVLSKSELTLFEVPLNISDTTFECSTDNDKYSKAIYFRVKGE